MGRIAERKCLNTQQNVCLPFTSSHSITVQPLTILQTAQRKLEVF